MSAVPWWKSGVVYQIYPRSFQDSDGDGLGDLPGITSRLGELEALGVDALWLSPIQPTPDKDFGYDISDYTGVDPRFGTESDLRALADRLHQRGMRLILDWVVNHSSDQHPWFQAARSSRDDPKRDWYIWAGDTRGRLPNNWKSTFGGPAWTWDEATGQHYLHSFLPEQPDLNWRNPELVDAVLDGMRHWLDLGVDGFRLDVFNAYLKDAELRDNPRRFNPPGWVYGYIGQHHVRDRDRPELADALRRMREVTDGYAERMMVGETLDERFQYDRAAGYVGDDRLHLAFNFRLLHSRWGSRSFGAAVRRWVGQLGDDRWPTWVLSNHDFPRHATRWGGGDERARLAGLLALTLRGTPFLYYGEELGMVEGRLSRAQIQDPPGRRFWPLFKGRDGARTPMQWDSSPHAGFTTGQPWLPVNPDAATRNLAAQRDDPRSVWSTYRDVIALRRRHPALSRGAMELPDADDAQVFTWLRTEGGERVRVALNMTGRPASLAVEPAEVLYSTHPRDAAGDPLRLAPWEGVVLRLT